VLATIFKPSALSLLIGLATSGVIYGQGALTPRAGTPSPPGATVYFVDIKDGATLPTKSTIRFGLNGMTLAPAGSDKENSGHHHLLIDAEVPPLGEPIPNDFNHLHFGNAQTEAEITLSPGEHTLQLLLGDKNHIPHSPPVMSERIKVIVAEGAAPVAQSAAPPSSGPVSDPSRRHPSPSNAKVYFIFPSDGAYVAPTSTIRFGLANMGIAPAGIDKPNTGHHHLLIDAPLPPLNEPIPLDFNHLHFGAGQTEAQVTLSPGVHTLQLLLGDENHVPHTPPVYSAPIKVTVTTSAAAMTAKIPEPATERLRARPQREPKRRVRQRPRAPQRSSYGEDEE